MNAIEFIQTCPPFEKLTTAELALIEQGVATHEYAAGELIFAQDGANTADLFIVRQGSITLSTEGTTVQILESGDLFGYPFTPSDQPAAFDIHAETDLLAYSISEPLFQQLVDNAAFADYFLQGIANRMRRALESNSSSPARDLATPIKHIMTCDPLFVDQNATVQHAAQAMQQRGASSALVRSTPPGILTDRDLRGRVLAQGLGPETPVHQVMSRPLKTLDSDVPVFGALLHMLDENIHHLALVEEGEIVGVITSTDLLRHQAHSPLQIMQQVESIAGNAQGKTSHDLVRFAENSTRMVESLFAGGVGAAQIGQIVSSLNDSLVARLLKLAEDDLGPPPAPYAWIVFGSEGRFEQMLLTDQDNALIYADPVNAAQAAARKEYFAALATMVIDGLITAGFPPCPGGYMATNWCKPLRYWQDLFGDAIAKPEPEAIMQAAIFFDFRKAYGELSLEPLEKLLVNARSSNLFIGHMIHGAQEFAPPLTFFRRIRQDDDGMVNIKAGGIAPIVGLARATALAAGSRERSTLERLTAAAAGGSISDEGAENLAETFQFLLKLRLRHQLAAIRAGQQPSNRIPVADLSPLERRHLKEAFMTIRQMQEGVGSAYGGR